MQTLEEQVKEVLIQKAADENYKLMQEPKYTDMIKKFVGDMVVSVLTAMPADEKEGLSEDEIAEMKEELDTEISATFASPDILKQAALSSARNQYITREELMAQLDQLYQTVVTGTGIISDAAFAQLKSKFNALLDKGLGNNDKVIAGYVNVAKRDGLEKVVTPEAEGEVTRKLYPTAEAYIAAGEEAYEAIKQVFTGFQEFTKSFGEGGVMFGSLFGALQQSIESMDEMNRDVFAARIQQKAKEIYSQ